MKTSPPSAPYPHSPHRGAGRIAALTLVLAARGFMQAPPVAPQEFLQEGARHHATAPGWPGGEVTRVHLAADGSPRVFAAGRWSELRAGVWQPLTHPAAGEAPAPALPAPAVVQVVRFGRTEYLATDGDIHAWTEGRLSSLGRPGGAKVNQIAVSPTGVLHVASAQGLFQLRATAWERLRVADGLGRLWAEEDARGIAFDAAGQLWFATRAGVGCRTPAGWRFFEGKDGLPWNDFTGLAAGPRGEMWFATHLGVIRWDGREFYYRQGPRWLPHDDVRQIAVDAAGTAWLATAGGLGAIGFSPLTLAAKAEYYEGEIERHVKRTPFGYVAEARLTRVGDRTSAQAGDSDNDGLWTAMYGAGECFAFAATQDPRARTRATQAFAALRHLQAVTQGGTPAPPKGYVARTIRPVAWPDPNQGRAEADRAAQANDPLWKVLSPRWPRSADGQWYWKSDTSSDELDGHYFLYPLYHDLVAATPEEKDQVRSVVRDLTDHLIRHGFTLTDHDGQPTRWARYGPETLNHDPRWFAERGLNSLSLLSYLAVAQHVTGDEKYGRVSRELIDRYGYAQNLTFPKAQFGPGSGNQSDDEMAFMCFYNLVRYSRDEALKNVARTAWFGYWQTEAAEMNPFFHFAYAAQSAGRSIQLVWGDFSASPYGDWHADALATLRGFPLDRVNWSHRNSHRLDLVRLPGGQSRDFYDPTDTGRGHRVNGRVLPVENRHFNHWNTDPWALDYAGKGDVLGAGTVFLLPYYLGLYHGFIAKPPAGETREAAAAR